MPRKLLLVASTGGHLTQLVKLAPGLDAADDSVWITFDSPQARSLLGGARTIYVPYVRPRDWVGVLKTTRLVNALLERERFEAGVSTGAGVAVGAFIAAAIHRLPLMYIESVSRVDGPSVSGRIIAALRIAELRTQHRCWADQRWKYTKGVLSEFASVPRIEARPHERSRRLFVTLGTIRPYRFDSAVDAIMRITSEEDEIVWQLGQTVRGDVSGTTYDMMPADDFRLQAKSADVVITHAGVGTIIQLLEWGVHPVVLIRRRSRQEHVDDHQAQIAELMAELGLATVADTTDLVAQHLTKASGQRIERIDARTT